MRPILIKQRDSMGNFASTSMWCLGFLLLDCLCAVSAENWTEFRGPGGQGLACTEGLPILWSETKNVVWKTSLPGKGYSSPVIYGNQVWMTTAHSMPVSKEEKARRLKGNTNSQPLVVVGNLSMRAICVEKSSGKLLHEIELMTEENPQPVNVLNSFASPTPVIEEGRLYCHFGTNGTSVLVSVNSASV